MEKNTSLKILDHDILLWVKVFGNGYYCVIKTDFVRKFTPDVTKRPVIFFDKSLNDKKDPDFSKWNIYRSNVEISQKDFKYFISLPNVKMSEGIAPAGNKYVDYYFETS